MVEPWEEDFPDDEVSLQQDHTTMEGFMTKDICLAHMRRFLFNALRFRRFSSIKSDLVTILT